MKRLLKSFAPKFILNWYYFGLAMSGAFLYGFPSRKMIVIGVTGTNGKSTVVEMCHQILVAAGFKVASMSSVRFKVNEKEELNTLKMTMPGRFRLQKFLREAVDAGCRYVVVEVTSEGIKQYRHKFIDFDVAVFTNLTPEHIESHGGFEAYKKAKGELFRTLALSKKKKKYSIINLDDPNAEYFLGFSAEKIGYAVNNFVEGANIRFVKASDIRIYEGGSEFNVNGMAMRIGLLGEFNIYNALAAVCVGLSQGIELKVIANALEIVKSVPGRMEIVAAEPFTVIVDYAHTPDALEKVYKTLKEIKPEMVCVLGAAGGGRDKWKRPELGKIAVRYCGKIILTDEDPYDENSEGILAEIQKGITEASFPKENVSEVLDRREAIRKALLSGDANKAVIITGKGSEPWMCVAGGKKIPWDDRKIAREELQKISKK